MVKRKIEETIEETIEELTKRKIKENMTIDIAIIENHIQHLIRGLKNEELNQFYKYKVILQLEVYIFKKRYLEKELMIMSKEL